MNTVLGELLASARECDDLAAVALEAANKRGIDEAKVTTVCTRQKKLVVENKKFTLANSVDTQVLKILVHQNHKKGSATINTSKKEAVAQAVADASALANFSVADEFLNLPDSMIAPKAKALDFLYDDHVAEMDFDALQTLMAEFLGALTKDSRIAIDRFEMGVDLTRNSLLNSRGVRQDELQSMLGWSWMGMAVEGEEVTTFDYDFEFSFDMSGVREKGVARAREFADRLLSMLRPGKCPSYKGPVLLSPRAVQSIIVGPSLYHMSGAAVMDKKSKWIDKVGQKVLGTQLSITDDPLNRHFSGATSYDGDGLPTCKKPLIESGILCTHLHDCYSAKRTGTKSNASAGGPFGLMIAPGKELRSSLLNGRTDMLVVDRFAGNSDPIKGDFSGVAKASRLLRNGKDAGPVTETMIAGNFFDIADKIIGVSTETEIVSGGFQAPWILVDGISVTGA
jgi:PmbA protein